MPNTPLHPSPFPVTVCWSKHTETYDTAEALGHRLALHKHRFWRCGRLLYVSGTLKHDRSSGQRAAPPALPTSLPAGPGPCSAAQVVPTVSARLDGPLERKSLQPLAEDVAPGEYAQLHIQVQDLSYSDLEYGSLRQELAFWCRSNPGWGTARSACQRAGRRATRCSSWWIRVLARGPTGGRRMKLSTGGLSRRQRGGARGRTPLAPGLQA